jgi:cob(I)alamin adenosyltransferase
MGVKKKGLIIVNTGNGKGKTTAALGTMLRAWGRNMKVCMVQFVKGSKSRYGEHRAADKLGIELISTGDGFTWMSKDIEESAKRAQYGWGITKEKISSGDYDLIVLDEMTYCFEFEWLDWEEVRSWLEAHKPPMLHIIITGRNASPELIEFADLVTEMNMVKHPFEDKGIKAQAGIEF